MSSTSGFEFFRQSSFFRKRGTAFSKAESRRVNSWLSVIELGALHLAVSLFALLPWLARSRSDSAR